MTLLKSLVTIFIAVYGGLLLLLYILQRQMIFQPSAGNIFDQNIAPFEAFEYTTPDGQELQGLWYKAETEKPLILYFHGNSGNIGHRLFKAKYFIDRGYSMAFVGYHGYNGAKGIPSETHLYDDGRAAIQAAIAKGFDLKNIVLYGESLGTGVATQMATEFPTIKALVLEAPYTSIPDVAAYHYWYFPVKMLVKDRFDSASKIGALKMPILIVHGTNDQTVPFRFGQELSTYVTSPQKKFVALEGANHSDIYNFSADGVVDDFIKNIQ